MKKLCSTAAARYEAGMCGIASIFAYHGDAPPVSLDELLAINQAMLRRGPDGAGDWISDDQRIGLSHRRLAIIDTSPDGAQPMAVETAAGAALHITYNGEIYNFRALRDELEATGVRFTSQSDTEVLLRLYERHGPAMVERLRGMFTFALWDASKRGMLLARDPFGIKPLYYADDGRTLRCASQVKALLAGGQVGSAPDPAGHAGFFLFGSVPEPHTLYADIRALPAGHTLWLDAGGGRRLEPFFDIARTLSEAGGDSAPLRDALLDSVRHHFVSDVPVGVFLSAGRDSAAITGLATECQGAGLKTFTLGFEEYAGTERDEVPLAEQIAAAYGTEHRSERVSRADFDAALPDILQAMDQPTVDGVNTYFVARAAARSGLKVALSGLGGDEMFAGYDTFSQVPKLAGAVGAIPGHRAVGHLVRVVLGPLIAAVASPKYAGLLEYGGSLGGAYLLRRGLFMPSELPNLIGPEMAREGWRALRPILRLDATCADIAEPENKVRALEMGWYMRNQLLRDADWAGMAHSLEIRTPLVDAELFRGLAPSLGRVGSPDKNAMAQTPATPLPAAVLERAKTGFFVPVEDWMHESNKRGERGLRGWARKVYAAQTHGAVC